MTLPPDIEQALADLDEELGSAAKVRLTPVRNRPRRQERAKTVDWEYVAEWLRAHPGVGFSATVHKNAIFRFRKAYPDVRVEGSDHRYHPETGVQVATMFAVYEPDNQPPPPPNIRPGPKARHEPRVPRSVPAELSDGKPVIKRREPAKRAKRRSKREPIKLTGEPVRIQPGELSRKRDA